MRLHETGLSGMVTAVSIPAADLPRPIRRMQEPHRLCCHARCACAHSEPCCAADGGCRKTAAHSCSSHRSRPRLNSAMLCYMRFVVQRAESIQVVETRKRRLRLEYQGGGGVHVMGATAREPLTAPRTAGGSERRKDWREDSLEVYVLMHGDATAMLDVRQAPGETPGARCMHALRRGTRAGGGGPPARRSDGAGSTVMVPSSMQQGEAILMKAAASQFVWQT